MFFLGARFEVRRFSFQTRILSRFLLSALLVSVAQSQTCFAFEFQDPFYVMNSSNYPPSLGRELDECMTLKVKSDEVLTLPKAVTTALCHNPKTSEAWANLQAQAAQVGIAKSAYLPTLSASGQIVVNRSNNDGTGTTGRPFEYSSSSTNHNISVNLNWVLYDFGLRASVLDNAEKTLLSALAKQDGALQSVISKTVKDYYAALIAQKNIEATKQFEANAKQALDLTVGRVRGGVAAISDQLQAQTAYSQAVYNRNKAEGDWQIALGTVAIDMGMRPNQSIQLSDANPEKSAESVVQSVDSMLKSAQETHPALRAARADLDAALANEKSLIAQGRPTLGLVGQYGTSQQSESPGGNQAFIETNRQNQYIGLKLEVPIFEGFSRTYKIRNAQARTDARESALNSAELEVATGVWTSYQQLKVSAINIQTSQEIVESAQLAFQAAQNRYQRGVTDIQELITTQNTFFNATQQHIKAIAEWQNAKIQLAASLGNLNLTTIQ